MRGYIRTIVFAAYIIATCSQTFSQINATFNAENFTVLSPVNIHNSILFNSPEHNFDYSDLAWAGDLDGDGYDDAYFNAGYCADERTGDEYDRVDKSYVVFGGDDLQSLNTLLLYYTVYPAGDINGDNRDDLIAVGIDGNFGILYGNNQTGFITGSKIFDPTLWWEYTSLPTEINGFCDFNGDGYGDIALALSTDNITIIYGALFDNMLSSAEYTIDYRRGVRTNKVKTGTFDNIPTRILSICVEEGDLINADPNDDQDIVFEMFNLSSGSPVLEETVILTTAVESMSISTSAYYLENYGALDVTGDGINEWIFGTDNKQLSFLSLATVLEWGGDLCDSSYYNVLKNIGDLNGDGREDFIWEDNDIGFTDENQLIIFGNAINYITTSVGDLNGDGFDDISALTSNTSETGYVLISSNNSSVLTESPLFLNAPLSAARVITMTQNIGDFDGDGFDDFVYYNNDSLWLYLAGPESAPLAAKITIKESESISKIISADFNGDGFEDIIVVARNSEFLETAYIDSCKIHFFMGSSVPDLAAEYIFDSNIWISSLTTNFELSIDAIGDINDDDKDDLVTSISSDRTTFKIIYGSNDPENAQIFSRSIPIESHHYVTGRAESVGDLNSDSIDDFVLGCVTFDENRSSPETGIFVYFGDGTGETTGSYEFPNLLIYEEIPDGYPNYLGMIITSGDYNGDGIVDIAVLPWGISKSTGDYDPDGYELLYIYYGGVDMDYLSDIKLNLPHRLFGVEMDGYINKFTSELNTVPDINDDGCDELFLGNQYIYNSTNPNHSQKYASILFGGSTLESGLITGFNLSGYGRIGSSVNGYYYSDFKSAVGDFDGDGSIELLARCSDENYQGTSIYEYRLKTSPTKIISSDNVRSLVVYPNPAKDYFNLDFGESNGLVHVDIYSSSGTRIFSEEINGFETISINHLEEGVYIIIAKHDNKLFSSKLVIIR